MKLRIKTALLSLCFLLACTASPNQQDVTGDNIAKDSQQSDVAELDNAGDTTFEDLIGDLADDTAQDIDASDNLALDELTTLDPDPVPEAEEPKDPFDPKDLAEWEPHLAQIHPRLFFDAADLPSLAEKMNASDGPHKTLAQRIRNRAARALPMHPDDTFSGPVSSTQGAIIEAAAFAGLVLEDQELTQKALAGLAAPYPSPRNMAYDSNYNLHEGEALVSMCSAWDWLASNPLADPQELGAAKERLTQRIEDYRYICREGNLLIMLLFAQNNHLMKYFGAVGLCAMSLNDRPTAAPDLHEAMTGLDFMFSEFQGNADGGYAEGWDYLAYGSNSYLPFYVAYHRWAQGRQLPYYSDPLLQNGYSKAGKIVTLPDIPDQVVPKAVYKRALWSTRPDGFMNATDDANPSPLHGAVLAWLFDDPAYLWQWLKPSVALFADKMDAISLVLYNGEAPPDDPGIKLEGTACEAGFAIMRSSWDADATFLTLQGEHGKMRVNGLGHEHPDELSFLLWADGQELIGDPGYIDWENRHKVHSPEDHNTILVDGKGAPFSGLALQGLDVGTDAFLSNMTHDGPTTTVSVATRYEKTDLQRRIVRLQDPETKHQVFIVEDRMNSETPHNYTMLLNTMAGGDVPESGIEFQDDGVEFFRGQAKMTVRTVSSQGQLSIDSRLQEYALRHGAWGYHTQLMLSADMDNLAGFLTILAPLDKPEITVSRVRDGVMMGTISFGGDSGWTVVSNQTDLAQDVAGLGMIEPGLAITTGEGQQVYHFLPNEPLCTEQENRTVYRAGEQ